MPDMGKDETNSAIAAAAEALVSFRKTSARERAHMLRKWYQLVMGSIDDLAQLITWENGKTLADSAVEVKYAADYIEWFSEEAPRIYGDTIQSSKAGHRVFTTKEPIGVCGLITPWNWPAGMVTRKVGAAIAAGCTVVLKCADKTPLTAAALAELSARAGIPKGVFNIVTTLEHTSEVGQALTGSELVRKISFTGSTCVGKLLMKQAASTLKKMSFELGGNAPFIVFDDADLDAAVAGAVACKFRGTGQTCICANRLYVHRQVYDEFAEKLTAEVKRFRVGPGYADGTTHGPLINDRAVRKVQEHIEDAVNKGGNILVGGQKVPSLGPNFFQPTVIRDMNATMLLAHDETFGPVAGLFPFDSDEEVLRLANDTVVGLAAYLYSKDIKRCYDVAAALEAGMIGINTGLISDTAMPFGGIKESGFGREGSRYGIDEYVTVKSVTIGGLGDADS